MDRMKFCDAASDAVDRWYWGMQLTKLPTDLLTSYYLSPLVDEGQTIICTQVTLIAMPQLAVVGNVPLIMKLYREGDDYTTQWIDMLTFDSSQNEYGFAMFDRSYEPALVLPVGLRLCAHFDFISGGFKPIELSARGWAIGQTQYEPTPLVFIDPMIRPIPIPPP